MRADKENLQRDSKTFAQKAGMQSKLNSGGPENHLQRPTEEIPDLDAVASYTGMRKLKCTGVIMGECLRQHNKQDRSSPAEAMKS
ncbi:MAG: hypothetical protein FRX49_07175 [Trebouxia sp. A1-2]|nr:MAG: hypothetical protein FRX49_07175 [Trebouxia sp. A1-2]